jgi:probable phosphoglycerate mutase
MEGVHLNEEGERQAESVASMLSEVPFKAIYSSPIDRTMETAQAIAAHHKLKIIKRAGIGEVRYGAWTGRSLKALSKTKLWTVIQRWPSNVRFPQGETLREVQSRALNEVERIREEHPKGVVCCVSHADTIKLIVAHYLGVHIDLFQRIFIGPASVSVVHIGQFGPQVLSLNALPTPRPVTS